MEGWMDKWMGEKRNGWIDDNDGDVDDLGGG